MADENTTQTEDFSGVTITQGTQAATYTADTSEQTEEELLAGKFKTPEDLVKAYKELEQKLGQSPKDEAKPEEDTADTADTAEEAAEDKPEDAAEDAAEDNPYGPVVAEALKTAELDLDNVRKEYADNGGKLEDGTFEALEKAGFPRPMVESYLRGLEQMQSNVDSETEAKVAAIIASVGGQEEFSKVRNYVDNSFTGEERKAYNDAISSGDPDRAALAVRVAHEAYLKDIGTETPLLGGGKSPAGAGGYASEAAWLEAMEDPRYKTSQAYRDEVVAKMKKSDFFVVR